MTTRLDRRYAGYRYPAEIIATAVWLYVRFPLRLRMVEDLLAARGITVSDETARQWARKFGPEIAARLRRRAPHQPTRRRERQMKRFKSPRQAQRFLSIHDPINNLLHLRRDNRPASDYRTARTQSFATWAEVVGVPMAA